MTELQIAYKTWEQAQAAREDLEAGGLLSVPLGTDCDGVRVSLTLPNGEVVRLRGEIAGTMLGEHGALDGVLLQFTPEAATLERMRSAAQRGPFAPDDVVRLSLLEQELAEHAAGEPEFPSSMEPQHSGMRMPRGRSQSEGRASKRPTLPAKDKTRK